MRISFVAGLVVSFCASSVAQVPDLSLTDAVGPPGSEVGVEVILSTPAAANGFALGVCNDPTEVTPAGVTPSPELLTSNDGDPPAFLQMTISPDHVVIAATIDFIGPATLPVGTYPLASIDYHIGMPAGGAASVACCNVNGVIVTLVTVNGIAVVPTLGTATVTSSLADPAFTFAVADATIDFDPATGSEAFSIDATIEEQPGSPGNPNGLHGFSMSLAHDPALLTALGAVPADALEPLNGGAGPDFFGVTVLPEGITVGVAFSFVDPTQTLSFPVAEGVAQLEYETVAGNLVGQLVPVTTVLDWRNGLGDPPITNTVVHSSAGETQPAAVMNAVLTLNPAAEVFIRGDCTGDGRYDIGDPIGLLGSLFAGGAPPPCEDACDGNDDGFVNVADAITLLAHLFSGGAPPPAPYPACNSDPTPDLLDCDTFVPCP